MSEIEQKKQPKKGVTSDAVKHYLLLIFIPSVLLIDKKGKDKTGHILTGLFAVCVAIFLISLIASGKANAVCLLGIVAIDAWGWLMYLISRNDNFLK